MAPPVDPQLDKAAAILADFGTFWELESSPAERRKLLTSLFERVWEQNGAITAVRLRYRARSRALLDSAGTASRACDGGFASSYLSKLDRLAS